MALPFPTDETFPMVLTPAKPGKKFNGSIRLKTVSGRNFVEITMDHPKAVGEAEVTYVSTDPTRGDMTGPNGGPITVTVSGHGPSSTWIFTSIAVFETARDGDGNKDTWVFCDSLTVDQVALTLTGIPDPVTVASIFDRKVMRLGRQIGVLHADTSKHGDIIRFFSNSGAEFPVRSNHNKVSWDFNLERYTGFRCRSGANGNEDEHAYTGTVPITAEIGILTEDDWEASLIHPLTAQDLALSFPFPLGTFRMVLTPPGSANRWPHANNSMIEFSVNAQGTKFATVSSGGHSSGPVAVVYTSTGARYGVFDPFSVTINSVVWAFDRITALAARGATFLSSPQVLIGSAPFRLTGLPLSVERLTGNFEVVQNRSLIGRLIIAASSNGLFVPEGGGQPDVVTLTEENVTWTHCREDFSGFIFILSLVYSPQTVVPKFGYLGSSVKTILTADDWEATLIP